MNPFKKLAELGYTDLVPIIPPDAEISPNSSLYKRVGTHQDGRGKTPGVRGANGKWHSFDWLNHVADERDFERWHAMGAGVGIKTGKVIVVDADTMDANYAALIKADVNGSNIAPIRIGRPPKALYVFRTDGPVPYQRVDFGPRDARGTPERVEVLSHGRQFVAQGIHPKTGKPYQWDRPLPPFDDLPLLPHDQVGPLLERLRKILPDAAPVIKEGAASDVDQQTLRGDPAVVRRAIEATPNTSDHFPTRESYLKMGFAIKASIPDEAEAFEVFQEWCDRWPGGNKPDVVASDWRRMKPPYKIGAPWLYDQAQDLSAGAFTVAEAYFDVLPDQEENPFAVAEAIEAKTEPKILIRASPYKFPDISTMPQRQWVYGSHLIRKFISATVAPSGVGKSSLTIAEALAMVSGKPLLGTAVAAPRRTWLWNGEDPLEEVERRVAAAMKFHNLTPDDIGDRLFLDSGRDTEIVLATDTRDGCKIAVPVVSALVATLKANRIDALVIDPFVSSHRVSENDNGAIDLVSKQWAKIADAANCAIDLVHHVRKLNGAEVTVEDSRGAVALIATSRSARALTKMTKAEAARLGLESGGLWRRLFRFGDGKNNLAAPVDLETTWFQLASVPLGNGSGDAIEAVLTGDNVGVVALFDGATEAAAALNDDTEISAVVSAVDAGNGEWRADIRSSSWVGGAVASALNMDLSDEAGKARVKAVVSKLLKQGVLRNVTRKDAKGMPRQYVEVGVLHADKMSDEDIFG